MIKRFLKKIRSSIWKKRFAANAIIGQEVECIAKVFCENSGDKNNIRIGNHCFIGCNFHSFYSGKITLGDNNYIGSHTTIWSKECVEIGNNVIISNNVLITDNNSHPTDPKMREKMSQCENYMTDELWSRKYAKSAPIKIEDNVWIGKNVTIMKGVTIGKGSIVALGAIVTKDVPPYTIVAGNPARVVKSLKED